MRYEKEVQEWSKIQYSHHDLRIQHLEDLAETAATRQNQDTKKALKCIIRAEQLKELHRKHKFIFKKQQKGLKSLLVKSNANNEDWRDIEDEDEIYNELLKVSEHKLSQSAKRSPLMMEPLVSMIGLSSETEFARNIIEGKNQDIPFIENLTAEENQMLSCLMESFNRPTRDGVTIPDLEWEFGKQQYRETFSKIREDVAVGPSGLIMPLWKAACHDEVLSDINAIFVELPFKYGFALKRWRNVVHTMIPKVDKPYVTKLRNIQLVEADYNGALKYIIGRQLRKYSESNGTSSDNTFGGRSNKNCIQMLKTIQTMNEVNRISYIPQAHLDIDAKGCFDNMATNVIGLAIQRIGGDKNLAVTQTKSLIQQQHRVKTTFGISPGSFGWSEKAKLGGSGQGSGASMINWHSFNEAIIKSYRKIMSKNKTKKEIDYHVKSFVDDNKLLYDFRAGTTIEEIKSTMRRGISTWSTLLRFTGGELSSPKCFFSIVRYNQRTDGTSRIEYTKEEDYKLEVSLNNEVKEIQHVKPRNGSRLLGVRISTSGNFNDEYHFRKQQSNDMATLIRRTKLSRTECYLIYKTRYKPRIHYPLPITTFTDKRTEEIERPFINELLPKLGVNRKMPRDVVFAPRFMGGMGLTKISHDQLVNHLWLMSKHLCNEDALGRNYEKLLIAYRITIGCQNNFLTEDPNYFFYKPDMTTNSMSYIWSKSWEYGIKLKIPMLDNLGPDNTKDRAIMDIILKKRDEAKGTDTHITDTQIRIINKCRLFCGVTWISEIVYDPIEMKIKDEMFDIGEHMHKEGYPYIENINDYMWRQWTHALHRISRCDRKIPKEFLIERKGRSQEILTDESYSEDTLPKMIGGLEPGLKQIIGKIQMEDKIIRYIMDVFKKGGIVNAWTDGSMIGNRNGHGYIILPDKKNYQHHMEGFGRTVDGTVMSSLRSEHSGVIAVLLIIKCIEELYGIDKGGEIKIWSDSMTVVHRTKEGANGITFDSTDYDLWHLSNNLITKLKTRVSIQHVKAHQDMRIGPLTFEQHYNVIVDKLARKGCYESNYATINGQGLPISVFVNDKQITANMKGTLYSHMTAGPIEEYIEGKFGWTREIYDTIDWKSFGLYATNIPVSKMANLIKYIYDWQYNKKWEVRIKDGEEKGERVISWECPMGCGKNETHRHYMKCNKIVNQTISKQMRNGIKIWMEKTMCESDLIRLLLAIIEDHQKDKLNIQNIREEIENKQYKKFIDEQSRIGWDNFFKGFISRELTIIQQSNYDTINEEREVNGVRQLSYKFTGEWWVKNLIGQLIYFSLSHWQIRNDYEHKKKEERDKINYRTILIEQVMDNYDRRTEAGEENQHLFEMAPLLRCMRTNIQIEAWLNTVESCRKTNENVVTLLKYMTL